MSKAILGNTRLGSSTENAPQQTATSYAPPPPPPGRRGLADISNVSSLAPNGGNGMKKILTTKTSSYSSTSSSVLDLAPLSLRGSTTRTATQNGFMRLVNGEMMYLFDYQHQNDQKYVTCYARLIFEEFLRQESKWMVNTDYMTLQQDITPRMRAILVDWLVEVHHKFKLLPQTLYICVNIIDRYLENIPTNRNELQLVGCTALWIASKYEEMWAPEPQDFVMISAKAFSKEDLMKMEGNLLNKIGFRMTNPTHYVFLTRWSHLLAADRKQRHMALYCVERSLQEYSFLRHLPSIVAATALKISLETIGPDEKNNVRPKWSDEYLSILKISKEAIMVCEHEMRLIIHDAPHRSLRAVLNKYSTEDFDFVACVHVDVPNLFSSSDSVPVISSSSSSAPQ